MNRKALIVLLLFALFSLELACGDTGGRSAIEPDGGTETFDPDASPEDDGGNEEFEPDVSSDEDDGMGAFVPIMDPESECESLVALRSDTKLNSRCYFVRGELVVSARMEIGPGVEFYFSQDSGIMVTEEGQLGAEGTAESPVIFTGVENRPGYWKGIYYVGSKLLHNNLRHVVIQAAGSGEWLASGGSKGALILHDSWTSVYDSTIQDNRGVGVLSLGSSLTGVTRVRLEYNEKPIIVQSDELSFMEDLEIANNGKDSIFIRDNGGINNDVEWKNFGVPYQVDGNLIFRKVVRINPGVVFEFTRDSGFEVNQGTLLADASGGAPIVFRGTENERGFWKGVGLYDSRRSENVLWNASITNAGSATWAGIFYEHKAGLYIHGGAYDIGHALLRLNDVTISGSPNCGISVEGISGYVYGCRNLQYSNNGTNVCAEYGIYCL